METKKRYAMAIVVSRCIDCKGCMIACKQEWSIAGDDFRTHIDAKKIDGGPCSTKTAFLPWQCNHCAKAPCVTVCPTKASHYREDGIVDMNNKRCVGCHYCVVACPYQARFFNKEKGVADKCTFCVPRVESGLNPACVNTCLSHARVFGDLNDPQSPISVLLNEAVKNNQKIWKSRPDLGTQPAIYYIG